ncbi:MAG: glycoside hydrolase family 13 protein [Bacteroidales bacterium]|nr:glycoside hydrolase family 13 protein [Bacteroidales bacterium]
MPAVKTNAYTDFYRHLAQLRAEHPALVSGSFKILSDTDDTLVYERRTEDDCATVSVQLKAPWAWSITTGADRVSRVEPPCWWVGMKTPLQLLVRGEGIGAYQVRIEGAGGVRVSETHAAESPNYLFIDVEVAPDAVPGTRQLVFTKGDDSFRVPYTLNARAEGSAQRGSFGTADAVYLIMPDRFVNGDPSNDETADTMENPAYDAFFGRHGGDLQGIEDQLDYIADLGFTAIWNTPLLEDDEPNSSYHGYACTDYYRIDSRFGSNEKYREFVREAHARGLKVIMDVVTNHCGDKHWWMEDLPFADWVHQWPAYTHSNCAFSAQNDPYCSQHDHENMVGGWFDTSMVDMNLDNPYVLRYFQQWAAWWTEWAGLDGFRVDTYPYNEKEPMSQWCASVREEYPALNIVGEVWSVNVPQVAYWQADNPNRDGFNSNLPSVMDFCLQSAICQGINTDRENWDEGITTRYDSVAIDFYIHDPQNMMVFAGNHDTDRIGDVVGRDPDKLKLVMTLLSTVRGYPQVFAGDELMVVSRDRSQGHGGLRVEFPQEWAQDPVQKDLHDYLRTLLQWRKTSTAVQQGRTLHFLSRDNTYAYWRIAEDGQTVFVYLNNNPEPREIPWADYAEVTSTLKGAGRDVISGESVNFEPRTVAGRSALVVEYK